MSDKQWKDGVPCNHPGCFNHVSHPCEGCGRIGGKYPIDIIAELRAQLETKEATFDILLENNSRHIRQRDEAWQKRKVAEQDRDNLQVQVWVMREILDRSRSIMLFHTLRCPMNIPNNYSGMEEHLAEYREVYQKVIPEVLKATPAEAGERVQELIKAVEWMKSTGKYFAYKAPEQIDATKLISAMCATADDALTKYRGGKSCSQ